MFLILRAMVNKTTKIIIPWKNIAKYVIASAIMANTLIYITKMPQFPANPKVHQILGLTAFGGLIYITIIALIDDDARKLTKSIWLEVKSKLQ